MSTAIQSPSAGATQPPQAASPLARKRRFGRLRYLGTRLVRLVSIIFGVTLVSFFLLKMTPGDPAATALGPDATQEQLDAMRAELGLNKPIWQQYTDWLGGILRGDFGETLIAPRRSVAGDLADRLPVTIELGVLAILVSLLVAVPLGVWSAHRRETTFDRVTSTLLYAVVSIPSFVAALLLIQIFVFNPELARNAALVVAIVAVAYAAMSWLRSRGSKRHSSGPGTPDSATPLLIGSLVVAAVCVAIYLLLPAFPRQGFVPLSESIGGNLKGVFLPVFTLVLVDIAIFTRLLRSDMATELMKPYVLASRARGMGTGHVLVTEALRPSLFSLITVVGLSIGQLIGGTIIVESIFRLPGVGSMLTTGVRGGDYPVVQACIFVIATAYVLINAIVDLSYAFLDSRVKQGRAR
ncbi:ABC transporter permease [Micromonospora sp. NPDC005206]|uniref:ABC transporter permease n=1 Tax=Micromonospora sp. NPDC005206 TaxID=3157022 RepID=UPI0033AF2DD4